MSNQTKAAPKRGRHDSPVIDAVCRQLEQQVPQEEARLVASFAEIFLSNAPPDCLDGRSTDKLAHLTRGAFEFMKGSRPERVDVEVFNPDVENEGWYAPVTVIRTNISERPFIVDSLREFLSAQGMAIGHIVYPVMHVERQDGALAVVSSSMVGGRRESLVHAEVARCADEVTLDFLRKEIARLVQDIVRATDDFEAMLDAARRTIDLLTERAADLPDQSDEIEEISAFLRWLEDGAFVFLGYRGYDLIPTDDGTTSILVEPGSGLGILRNEAESAFAEPVRIQDLPPGIRELVETGPLLIISKTNAEATVHRRARMDYIGVKKLSPDGRVVGEHRFMGLFTSKVYANEAEQIPILRRKLEQIIEEAGVSEGTHDYKEINTIFNSMPKEELFLTSAEEIGADIRTVLAAYQTEQVRVALREDPLSRGVAAMVILPKDRFSGEIRKEIEESFVSAFEGELLNYHLALGGSTTTWRAGEGIRPGSTSILPRAVRSWTKSTPRRSRRPFAS